MPSEKRGAPAVPDHEVLHLIGSGAYGDVWLARNSIGTLRALKVVWRASFSSDRPYEREFSGMLKFEPVSRSHEGFVDILQVGQGPGYFYYVMELADNAAGPGQPYRPRTLSAEARAAGRLPAAACQRHFLMLSDALAALHRAGLIHRDIKPSNIILVGGVAKLADIGLVAAMDAERSFVGTEGFIPPEGPGSAPADIYSLGKVLYEVATGKDRMEFPSLPYDAVTGRTADELLEINAVITKACATAARDRYATALEMHAELALLQSGRSVKKFRVLEERLRWARQAGAVAGVLALLAVGGFLVAGSRARLARENSERLEQALNRATSAERQAENRLYEALAATGVAERRSGLLGQRFASLKAIISAAEIRPGAPELRDAAITALAVPDLRETGHWPLPAGFQVQGFSADLATIYRAATNGGIDARRAADGQLLFQLPTPPVKILGLYAGNGSGRWLGVRRAEIGFTWWDLANRRIVRELPQSFWGIVSGDDRWLAELVAGNRLRLHDLSSTNSWDVPTSEPVNIISPGGEGKLITALKDGDTVAVREFATGAVQQSCKLPEGEVVYCCRASPDGRWLVVGTRMGRVLIWDLDHPTVPPVNLHPHSSAVTSGAIHPDSDWCITTSWDGTTRLLGLTEGRVLSVGRRESGVGQFSPDGDRFGAVDANEPDLRRFEAGSREVCRVLAEPGNGAGSFPGPWHAAFLAEGRLLAASSFDSVRIYDTVRGRQVAQLPSTNWYAVCLAGDSLLYAAGPNGMARWPVRGLATDEITFGPMEFLDDNHYFDIQANPDGKLVVATGTNYFSFLRAGGVRTNLTHLSPIRGTSLSRDGARMATMDLRNGSRVWDVATGTVLRRFADSKRGGFALSPDGRQLLVNSSGAVVLLQVDGGGEVWRIPCVGLGGAAAWTDDGSLVCVVRDGMVPTLIEARSGAVLGRFEHPDYVPYNSVVFSAAGDQMACVSTTHVIHLWNFRPLRRELAKLKLDWDQPALGDPVTRRVVPVVRLTGRVP